MGLRKGKEKEPYWEKELVEPLKCDRKRTVLEPTSGETERASKVSNQGGKKVKVRFRLWTLRNK